MHDKDIPFRGLLITVLLTSLALWWATPNSSWPQSNSTIFIHVRRCHLTFFGYCPANMLTVTKDSVGQTRAQINLQWCTFSTKVRKQCARTGQMFYNRLISLLYYKTNGICFFRNRSVCLKKYLFFFLWKYGTGQVSEWE